MRAFQHLKYIFIFIFLIAIGCVNHRYEPLYGYIEGEYIYISSGVPGTLFNLAVKRGESVKKGELLYTLDPEPETSRLKAAKAAFAQSQAEVTLAAVQLLRQQKLYAKNVTDKATLDQVQTDYTSKIQKLKQEEANITQADWALHQKIQYAPIESRVFDTFFRLGENVPAHQPILALLSPEYIKVLFFIPEKKLSQIHLGQNITFTCDGCDGKTPATITYISPEAEYTPPIIYSKDTRNKLVYLVRASMPLDVAKKFHPGQPIEVTLHE